MFASLAFVRVVTAIVTRLHIRRQEERRSLTLPPPRPQSVGVQELIERLDRLERRLAALAEKETIP
jgi:hypothetical protein